jgi:hypothetical protein
MTSPRGAYGGGYYASRAFPDTPIYDSLVAERGTPQIAPIRVPSAYEPSNLPALPALPSSVPAHTPPHGMQTGYMGGPQPSAYGQVAPLQNTPMPYIPQQAAAPRGGYSNGYSHGAGYQTQAPYQNGSSYATGARPVPPRPAPPRQAPAPYGDAQYGRPYPGQGY